MKTFFVHIPKTAGISFRNNLQKFYLPTKSLHVYLDNHMAGKNINDYDLVTGHIMPNKDDISADRIMITWLRNPIDRLISQFFYQKYYNTSNSDSTLCWKGYPKKIDDFLDEFLEYALKEDNKNIITIDYFSEVDIFDYDFIGITENFTKDQELFFKNFFNAHITQKYFENYNSMIIKESGTNSYFIDNVLRKKLELFHSEDMDLYNNILDLRKIKLQ